MHTVAVVTAYNPPSTLLRNCEALRAQCSGVVVVDDGSDGADDALFDGLRTLGCSVVRLDSNQGIASALNAGVKQARALHPALGYVLTMDQDSLIEPGFVRLLENAAKAAASAGIRVGMVAPGEVSGLPNRARGVIDGITLGDEPVQSGLLIPIESVDELGPFNERLFIDGVDSEFYLRAKTARMSCVIAQGASLEHSLGQMLPARLGPFAVKWRGRELMVRTAASWRYYYIVRNRVFLSKLYLGRQPFWTVRGLLLDVRHILLVSAFAEGRLVRLSAALRGLKDGIRGRMGPSPLAKSH